MVVSLEGSAELLWAYPVPRDNAPTYGGPSSLPAQDASSCIRTMQDWFAAPVAHAEEEPSPKRRKTGNGHCQPILSRLQADLNRKESIVLARVSIQLVSGLVHACDAELTLA
jgi:hypothetical protein